MHVIEDVVASVVPLALVFVLEESFSLSLRLQQILVLGLRLQRRDVALAEDLLPIDSFEEGMALNGGDTT